LGSKSGVLASFSAMGDADTWETGLGTVEHVHINNGAHGRTYGATFSGGTVTFKCSGAMTSPITVIAVGLL
jgi:hypothetical protein